MRIQIAPEQQEELKLKNSRKSMRVIMTHNYTEKRQQIFLIHECMSNIR